MHLRDTDTQAIKARTRTLITACGGLEYLAEGLGLRVGKVSLSNYMNANHNAVVPLDIAIEMMVECGNTALLDFAAELVARSPAHPVRAGAFGKTLPAAVKAAHQEAADVVSAVIDALDDGEVSDAELRLLLKEAREAQAAFTKTIATLEAEAGKRGLRIDAR